MIRCIDELISCIFILFYIIHCVDSCFSSAIDLWLTIILGIECL